jgi:hypothetical protein
MPAPRGAAVALACLLALPACREVARALGAGSAGPVGASDFLVALATRFGPVERGAGFDAARPRLARAALVPSRVFDAKDLWTTTEGEARQLEFHGARVADRYRIDLRPQAPPPTAVGEYRGRVRLRHVDDGRFEWTVRDELCVGPAAPDDLSHALTALLRAGEGVSGEVARLRAREAFPRATAAFSRLFDLETLDLHPSEGGSTAILLGLRLRPDRLREAAPRYAAFLDKYASPIRLAVVATDATGDTWWAFETAGKAWTLRLRVRGGSLVPLSGSPERRVPDRLRLAIDYATKEGIFTIGVRGLVADVELTREPQEKAFVARFAQEPAWRLPFLIKPLIRGSLRYPFENGGMSLGYALRGRPDQPTRLVRDYRLRVQESWIIRWLGGLSDRAVSDFRRGAEAEADRFSRECLYAVRDAGVAGVNEGG